MNGVKDILRAMTTYQFSLKVKENIIPWMFKNLIQIKQMHNLDIHLR